MDKIFGNNISKDFEELKKIIYENLWVKNNSNGEYIFERLKKAHTFIYLFKYISYNVDYKKESSKEAIEQMLDSILNSIYDLAMSRYKSFVANYRMALEMFVKSLVRELSNEEKNSFSNNIEKAIRDFLDEKNIENRKDKDKLKKIINNYSNNLKQIYYKLSDVIHCKKGKEFKGINEYFNQLLYIEENYDKVQFDYLIGIMEESLLYCIELFMLINFYKMDSINLMARDVIIGNFSDDFKYARDIISINAL